MPVMKVVNICICWAKDNVGMRMSEWLSQALNYFYLLLFFFSSFPFNLSTSGFPASSSRLTILLLSLSWLF
jgi:hypothetical protein